jgi:hypothetical protein
MIMLVLRWKVQN